MKSYLMVITAMLIWGSSGVFRRYIPVPSDFLAFLRGVLGSLFMLFLTTTGMVLVSGITETESVDVNQLKGVIFGLSAGLLFCPKIETGVGFRPSVADGTGRSHTIPDEKHNRFYVPFIYVYIRFT